MSYLHDRDPIYGLHEDDSDFEPRRNHEEPLFLLNELSPEARQRTVEKLKAFDRTGLPQLGLISMLLLTLGAPFIYACYCMLQKYFIW